MRNWQNMILGVLLGLFSGPAAFAGPGRDRLISPVEASRAGLVVQWFAHLEAADAESLVGVDLVVDENRGTTFFEIAGGGLREIFSEHDLGPDGRPMGIEGGAEIAEIRREFLQAVLDRNEKEGTVTVEKHILPWTTLYTLSDTGMLNAIDAESGKLRWRIEVGSRLQPTIGMGASKRHVAVVNGSTVWCLDADTGKTLWSHRLSRRVTGAPVVNERFIFVPSSDGRLETLPIDGQGWGATVYVASGDAAAAVQPVLEGDSVVWATSRGVTVAPATRVGPMRFRVNSDSPVVARPAARGGVLFVASREGYVYAVSEITAALLWKSAMGDRITRSPVPLGDDLYVLTEGNRLHRLDARTGQAADGWTGPVEGVRQFVGASQSRLYLLDTLGRLAVLDRTSGLNLGTVSSGLSLRSFSNLQSDRLYVCHSSGLVQCLREATSPRPVFHGDDWTELASREPAVTPGEDSGMPAPDNPFGASDNPFGGSDNPFGDNPFGSGSAPSRQPASDDPFGGGSSGGSSGDADPFGGGNMRGGGGAADDPFAGGGENAPAGGNRDAAVSPPADPPPAAPEKPQQVLWKDVEEIFQRNCAGCHGKRNPKANFDVTTYASIMKGSQLGTMITRGGPDNSRLFLLITHKEQPVMPPRKKLSDDDIALIRQWIADGAREQPKTDAP